MRIGRKGLSDIVTNVLIILLVLVAIGIIWYFVSPFIRSSAGSVQGTQDCLTIALTPVSCVHKSGTTGAYNVTFRRDAGAGNLKEVKLIFKDANGATVVANTTNFPQQFESRVLTDLPNSTSTTVYTQVDIAAVVSTDDPAGRTCDPRGTPVQCA